MVAFFITDYETQIDKDLTPGLWSWSRNLPFNERRLHNSLIQSLYHGDLERSKKTLQDLKERYQFNPNSFLYFWKSSCIRLVELIYSLVFEKNHDATNALMWLINEENINLNSDCVLKLFSSVNFESREIFQFQKKVLDLILESGVKFNDPRKGTPLHLILKKMEKDETNPLKLEYIYYCLQQGFVLNACSDNLIFNNMIETKREGFQVYFDWPFIATLYCFEKKGISIIF